MPHVSENVLFLLGTDVFDDVTICCVFGNLERDINMIGVEKAIAGRPWKSSPKRAEFTSFCQGLTTLKTLVNVNYWL